MAICIYHRPDDAVVIPNIVMELNGSYITYKTKNQAYYY